MVHRLPAQIVMRKISLICEYYRILVPAVVGRDACIQRGAWFKPHAQRLGRFRWAGWDIFDAVAEGGSGRIAPAYTILSGIPPGSKEQVWNEGPAICRDFTPLNSRVF
jgi:hypothetical protein